MSTLGARSLGSPDDTGTGNGPGSDAEGYQVSGAPLEPDEYSLAFAMIALLLACGLLAGIVVVLWALTGL